MRKKSQRWKPRENLSSKDPAVREKAEKEEKRLVVLSVERDKEVIAACSGPGASSEACKQKRTEAVLAQMGYEDGPYNSKYKDAYPDEYQHISAILDQTSQKTQDQLAVRDAVAANLAKTDNISLEEAYKKYDRYAATRDVIAIVGGTIGGIGVANRIPGEKPAGSAGSAGQATLINISENVVFSSKQLDKKFKHAGDFGVVPTRENKETIDQYEVAIKSHLDNKTTYEHGTYLLVPESKVFFNPQENNVVVIDKSGGFVSGWKLDPTTKQYENFIKNGTLR